MTIMILLLYDYLYTFVKDNRHDNFVEHLNQTATFKWDILYDNEYNTGRPQCAQTLVARFRLLCRWMCILLLK